MKQKETGSIIILILVGLVILVGTASLIINYSPLGQGRNTTPLEITGDRTISLPSPPVTFFTDLDASSEAAPPVSLNLAPSPSPSPNPTSKTFPKSAFDLAKERATPEPSPSPSPSPSESPPPNPSPSTSP